MRAISLYEFAITNDAAGAGTVDSSWPISGELVEVRLPTTTSLVNGATADIAITRVIDGGTLAYLENIGAGRQIFCRGTVTTFLGGTTAYAIGGGPVLDSGGPPVDGYVRCTVASGSVSGSGTVYAYFRV